MEVEEGEEGVQAPVEVEEGAEGREGPFMPSPPRVTGQLIKIQNPDPFYRKGNLADRACTGMQWIRYP